MSDRREHITALLAEVHAGTPQAWDQLVPLVYDELRTIARGKLRRERADHTLNTTALVHEAYERLVDQRRASWKSRSHFYVVAAQAMRRVLVNHAIAQKAQKRGGGIRPLSIDQHELSVSDLTRPAHLLALDEALTRLAVFNERGAKVVEYRFFGGLNYDEIAEVMGLSKATV
ncbi:MAG: ECF-type sigma factor, partial [Bacteroidota bacterium]